MLCGEVACVNLLSGSASSCTVRVRQHTRVKTEVTRVLFAIQHAHGYGFVFSDVSECFSSQTTYLLSTHTYLLSTHRRLICSALTAHSSQHGLGNPRELVGPEVSL